MPLDLDDIDAIAVRLAELLDRPAKKRGTRGLATAEEVAACLGVARRWVYANKERLGAIRLGEGPKARLRFDLDRAAEALRDEGASRPAPRVHSRAARGVLPPGVELIEGRGRGGRRAD